MRMGVIVVVLTLLASVAGASASPARHELGVQKKPRVTFVGDSVPAALNYVTSARKYLARGLHLRYELDVCRRLVSPSCTYQGNQPPTALESIEADGRKLGDVVVIDVGYNDSASTYRRDLNRVMRELVSDGVSTVIWVTMRETRSYYAEINDVIRHAKRRWSQLIVADWNARSRGHASWFGDDGLHLNNSGAWGLANLLRPLVVASANGRG